MLLHIRERAQGWIAIAIVGFLILGLSTFAWNALFSPDPEVPVSAVNGEKITSAEYQREYQQQRAIMQSRLRKMLGDSADISQFLPDEQVFKQNVLKRLQEEELSYQVTQQEGYRVGDSMLAQQIRGFEAFQKDGKFSSEAYKNWLSQNYYSSADFEEILRRDAVVQQFRLGVMATEWVSKEEKNALIKLQQQERDISYIVIPAKQYVDKVEVNDEEAQTYFDNNQAQYATEEQVSAEYLELVLADLAKDVDVDEDALHQQYEERQSEFGVPEERRTRHILIEVAGDASDEEKAKAKEKAASLVAKLRDGAGFVALAKENSDDLGSAADGGDLGFLSFDSMMDPSYADAAFALAKGEVSEPVKSAYGYHIIEVTDIKKGSVKSFEEVRDQLAEEYRLKQAEDKFLDQSEMLANLTFENPDTLQIAADELGIKIKTTPLFGRNFGPGLASEAKVREAAFSDDVLTEGLNSQPIELTGDRVVVLRVKEHHPSATRPFDEVKEQIVAKLKQDKAKAKAEEEGQAMLESLASNGDMSAVAAQGKYKLEKPDAALTRASTAVSRELVTKAFRMGYPAEGEALYAGTAMNNGDYAVIALSAVRDGEAEANQADALGTKRENYYGTNELLETMADLRSAAEIKEYPENF